jgi:hypothetical protein
MHHIMKKASVRDLRYHAEIEAQLNKGEEIEVHKRRKVIAHLLPVQPALESYPDFSALSRRIFGRKKTRTTATGLVSQDRGPF